MLAISSKMLCITHPKRGQQPDRLYAR